MAKHERDSLRETKTALGQKCFHLLLPQSLRFLLPYASLELINVIASPDGMRKKADHRVDHCDQQLPLALENPPGFLQYPDPLRLRDVVQAGEHDYGVEVSIRGRQASGIAHHIHTRPWIDIYPDGHALSRPVAPSEI